LAIVRLRKRKVFVGFATPTTFEKVDQTFIIALKSILLKHNCQTFDK